jgi:hypothetical protein
MEASMSDVDGWNPIETAEGDGRVLGYIPSEAEGRRYAIVKLRGGKPFVVDSKFHFDSKPVTHWRNFPLPPALKGNQ